MPIEVTSQKRRLVLDWVLVGVIVACCTAFFDMRSTVQSQTKSFDALALRLARVEGDLQSVPSSTATKQDIARLEGRIDQLVTMMMAQSQRND
jgi:hypothetical protein